MITSFWREMPEWMLSFSLERDSVHSGISLQKGAFVVCYGFSKRWLNFSNAVLRNIKFFVLIFSWIVSTLSLDPQNCITPTTTPSQSRKTVSRKDSGRSSTKKIFSVSFQVSICIYLLFLIKYVHKSTCVHIYTVTAPNMFFGGLFWWLLLFPAKTNPKRIFWECIYLDRKILY